MESPLTTLRYKVFFDLNHIEEFVVKEVRRAHIPAIGDKFSFGSDLQTGTVSDRVWQIDGSVNVYIDVTNDIVLYRALFEQGWDLQETDPNIAT
jgi:hypothetical protein